MFGSILAAYVQTKGGEARCLAHQGLPLLGEIPVDVKLSGIGMGGLVDEEHAGGTRYKGTSLLQPLEHADGRPFPGESQHIIFAKADGHGHRSLGNPLRYLALVTGKPHFLRRELPYEGLPEVRVDPVEKEGGVAR